MPIDKDLQEIISTAGNIAKTLLQRLKDGFQPLPDLMAMFPAMMGAQTAVEGNENAWKYLFPLNETKTEETISAIMTEIGEASEEAREIVRHSLMVAAHGYMLFQASKKLGNKNTAAPQK